MASAPISRACLAYSTESSVRVPPVPTMRAVRPLMTSLAKAARAHRSSAVCA